MKISFVKKRFNLVLTLEHYQPLTGVLGLATIVTSLLLLLPSIGQAQTYTNSITITEGGTYSGSWESWTPEEPAVTIATEEPVTLDGCNVRGNANLIFAHAGSNVTVKNCNGYGYFSNQPGQPKGHFFKSWQAEHVNIHNNYLEGTTGIRIQGYTGDRSTDEVIMVRFNIAKNIDGRMPLGSNGQPSFEPYSTRGNFVQLLDVQQVPNVEISWNQVINEPGHSRTEDVINIFNSSGTSTSPIRVAANYIKGSYAARPESQDFSGGGIMCGDGGPNDNHPNQVPAYIDCDYNQVVNASNYGMAIAKGHHITMRNNRIVSSGMIGDTKIFKSWLGAYIWNYYAKNKVEDCSSDGYDNDNTDIWHNNGAYNNYIGGTHNIGGVGHRADWLFCDADQSLTSGNVHWEPEGGPITSAMEDEEWNVWQNKLSTHGLQIGPLPQE